MNRGRFIPRDIRLRHVAAGLVIAGLALTLSGCNPTQESMTGPNEAEALPPAAATTAPATGEVPADLLEKIYADLVEQETLRREDIEVERSESVIWSDGSLGCPEPGVMYTQAQVPGYWIVLRSGGKQYDYRASEKGQFRRCKGSSRMQLPVG